MKKLITLLSIALFITQAVQAENLKSAALLNKISMSLRGIPSSLADQKVISKLSVEEQAKMLELKIDEYQKSTEYTEKMNLRLLELFQFKANSITPSLAASTNIGSQGLYNSNNATYNLFSDLTKNNLSWDTLLTGKSYLISSLNTNSFNTIISDYGFYGRLANLPQTGNGDVANSEDVVDLLDLPNIRIDFSPNDLRIAGVLTTPKFLARYVNTGVNKNRRRAAAIFKVFLCDSMNAVIPSMAGVDDATLGLIFPGQSSKDQFTETEIKAILAKNDSIHGSKTDCKACHYKLDPVGKVFNTSAIIIGEQASPGALVYKNSKGVVVNKPVQGVAELGQRITEEDDYVNCQVRHFWNWYIGEDVSMTPEIQKQLVSDFESTGRKTNDFIKRIILRPEFAKREESNEIKDLARGVRTFMKRCQACHQNSEDYGGADLTKWPLGNSLDNPKDNPDFWVKKISKALDLPNSGLKRTMPPKLEEGGYIVTKQDLEMINKWIKLGAPDEDGKIQVKPAEVTP